MVTTTNNPELLKLIGMKFHVRDTTEHTDFPEHVRQFLVAAALDADMYVHSIIFNADSQPEIGLAQDMNDPDHMEYYRASALIFSAPAGSSDPLPAGLFHHDGSLIALIHQQLSEAA